MKVITKCVIEIKTGKILEEESYEYHGPVAKCFDSGGGGVSYSQSPQQEAIYELLFPIIQRLSGYATGQPIGGTTAQPAIFKEDLIPSTPSWFRDQYLAESFPTSPTEEDINQAWRQRFISEHPYEEGSQYWTAPVEGTPGETITSLWDIPEMPQYPDMPEMYQIPGMEGYTYESLPPELKTSMMAPYKDVESQMLETFGGRGAGGSMRGGYSGAAGAAGGKLWSDAANQMQMQGWNMMQPAWQGQLEANKLEYMTDWQQRLGEYGGQMQGWQSQLQENMFPYSMLPGMMGGTYGSPVVNPYEPSQASQMAPYLLMLLSLM